MRLMMLGRLKYILPLVLKPSSIEIETGIKKLKSYKMPGTYQILTELIKAGGNTSCSEIHKLINSAWNKEQLPEQWKESIIIPKVIKVTSNYWGISLLPTTYKILSNILLSRLTTYIDKINGDHQCRF
jgi:hypothetical protein